MLRRLVLLITGCAGAYAALQLLDAAVVKAGAAGEFVLKDETLLLVLPVCLVGALLGAVCGSLLLPRRM
jgi:hypothetical protein